MRGLLPPGHIRPLTSGYTSAKLTYAYAESADGSACTNDDWRYPHVGDLLFWYFMVVCHLDPNEYIRLWHVGDRLVGYAVLGEDPSFDCQVLPAYAWQGIEDEALAWAESRISELRKIDAQRWGGAIVSGSRQDDAKRRAFLEQHGFHIGGEFSEVNMLCTLDRPIPTAVLPAGCQVRAVAEDSRVRFQTAPQPIAMSGSRGRLATCAPRIMRIL